MDTKSKASFWPTVALVLSLFLFTFTLLAAVDVYDNREKLDSHAYFTSSEFASRVDEFTTAFVKYYSDFRGYEELTYEEKYTKEEIAEIKQKVDERFRRDEENLYYKYKSNIQLAEEQNNTEKLALLKKQKEQELQSLNTSYTESVNNIIPNLIAEKDRSYKQVKMNFIKLENHFQYYLKNQDTGRVVANINPPDEASLDNDALYYFKIPSYSSNPKLLAVTSSLSERNWTGYLVVPDAASNHSPVHADYYYYANVKDRLMWVNVLGIISLAGAVALFVYYWRNKKNPAHTLDTASSIIRIIPLDLQIILFGIISLFTMRYASNVSFFYLPIEIAHFFALIFIASLLGYIALQIREFYRLATNERERQAEWQRSFLGKLRTLWAESKVNKSLLMKVIIFGFLTGGFALSLLLSIVSLSAREELFLLISVLYNLFYLIVVVPLTLRKISTLNKIMRAAEEMASGNLQMTIKEPKDKNFVDLTRNLNNMRVGMQKSMQNQIKSEKLKTELITNVSHDLRTPLTSIINYVDLLKREDITEEEKKNYMDILDKKTQRLKILIDDLIEASKVASGTVDLHTERLNVVSLLNQALAEFNETIKKSSLTFRLQVQHQNIYATLDGRKTWRVFENLISNAVKYSLPNTRVYLSLTEDDYHVFFTIKNVSAYEIDFDIDELFERFKRGDQSRHTEGSGLGLAIAKSIVELQGGQLFIDIDGDYFKVTAVFNK
ncbi:sensor histidine kinase [Brevibacillus daliensis]|uniref:sensor histidine kinase n=1 Tax=Brevibacillus daliensis TaxID=2892995 RepID=UPI001E55C06C|nr:HAMP domain-containing sensor histidine kinase [Brevibacillus daliensis]